MNERNVPEVRFRGFSGEWNKSELRNLLDVCSGQDYKHLSDGDVPVYGTGGYMLSVDKALSYKDDAIGIGRKGTIDKPYLLNAPFWTVDTLFYAIPKKQNDLHFLYCEMQKIDWKSKDESTGVPSLSSTTINAVKFLTPEYPEQTKIGDFFKNLDNLIAQNQKKYDKLVNMKKACLDKMFPKDGADTPEVRFKGFNGKWTMCKIKNICSISTGKSNTQDRIENGKYPFYVRSSIIEHSNRYLFDEEAVLTVGDGVGTGKVFHYVNGKYDLHQRVYRMFDFDDEIVAKYFYYYFAIFFYSRVMSMTAKTSVDSVRLEMISEMDFVYPIKKEQQKLIDYLDNLDTLITAQKTKLEKLKNIKKACLDKMFI